MKAYKFAVILCGGYCGGYLEIKANNEDEAYSIAEDYVAEGLVKAFPTLDIPYNIEEVEE